MKKAVSPSEWISEVQAGTDTVFLFSLADSESYLCPQCSRKELTERGNKFQLISDGIIKVYANDPTFFQPGEHTCSGCDCDLFTLEPFWSDKDIIHSYSRSQAIKDGVLVDVSEAASQHGFNHPVAIASDAYAMCVEWQGYQLANLNIKRTHVRLDNVLMIAKSESNSLNKPTSRFHFNLYYVDQKTETLAIAQLLVVCSPGDEGEPVITIMCPHEE